MQLHDFQSQYYNPSARPIDVSYLCSAIFPGFTASPQILQCSKKELHTFSCLLRCFRLISLPHPFGHLIMWNGHSARCDDNNKP